MLKRLIINSSLNTITKFYPEYDNDKMDEIRYGLEATYMSLTKVVVILLISLILGIIKESVILLLFFNGLRTTGFGLHASRSYQCWISSLSLFIGIPYLCMYVELPLFIYYILLFLSILSFILYAPADTVKRPLIKRKKRIIYKILTIVIAIIYIFIFLIIDNSLIRNIITSSMVIEAVLIHPYTYRMFNLPYRNYRSYVLVNKE